MLFKDVTIGHYFYCGSIYKKIDGYHGADHYGEKRSFLANDGVYTGVHLCSIVVGTTLIYNNKGYIKLPKGFVCENDNITLRQLDQNTEVFVE